MVEYNNLLGRLKLNNINKQKKGVPRIEVTFEADCDGIIKVETVDKNTGEKQNVEIQNKSTISEEDIKKIIKEAKKNEIKDKKKVLKRESVVSN